MHTSAGRCGGRANKDIPDGGRVGHRPHCGSGKELGKILDAAIDVAADVIGIVLLKGKWVHYMSCQHTVAKARGKAFDLRFNALGHIECRAMRNMAVYPQGMLACWCPCRIEQALLCDQQKG